MRPEPADPHDQLLLTERPVTIVTQNTTGMDSMPSPYGASEDEEALFAQVGSDDGFARSPRTSHFAGTPGVETEDVEECAGMGASVIQAEAQSQFKNLGMVIAGALLVGWLVTRK